MSRYAIYYAPQPDDPLWQAGCAWLGRDPAGGAPAPGPAIMAEITADARHYGFHATLKPPMRLREDCGADDALAGLRAVAASIPAFPLPPLAVHDWHGFLCLRETQPSPELQALADACVAGLDHLRAPPGVEELARRRAGGLTPAQEANLVRWGYPQVFATWFFHMTLTRRLNAVERAELLPRSQAWFAPALDRPRMVSDICLYFQEHSAAPFELLERAACAGAAG